MAIGPFAIMIPTATTSLLLWFFVRARLGRRRAVEIARERGLPATAVRSEATAFEWSVGAAAIVSALTAVIAVVTLGS